MLSDLKQFLTRLFPLNLINNGVLSLVSRFGSIIEVMISLPGRKISAEKRRGELSESQRNLCATAVKNSFQHHIYDIAQSFKSFGGVALCLLLNYFCIGAKKLLFAEKKGKSRRFPAM